VRGSEEFDAFNTEPTALYDANQRRNTNINFSRGEEEDVTGDNIPEIGRLSNGAHEMHRLLSQRDTNRLTNLIDTFKIHSGSRTKIRFSELPNRPSR
jgi:hypothetical protein